MLIFLTTEYLFSGLCLSKHGDETKLQSFNLKEILKGSWDLCKDILSVRSVRFEGLLSVGGIRYEMLCFVIS